MTLLRTPRLTLTTLTRDEAAAVRADDREGRGWAPDYPTAGDLLVAAVVLEAGDAYDEDAPLGPMQLRRSATGEVIGGIGFLHAPDPDGTVEIGYGLAESARGQGYATEAVEAMVAFAMAQGASAVVAMTTADNAPSQRVLQRCGFVASGTVESDDGPLLRWVR
ncbi:MAG: GNAT family N-acetyltransferase [Candidatus Nanopelagicales bacterium]